MANFNYIAVDATGHEFSGMVDEKTQTKALKRVKEMGLFPTRLKEKAGAPAPGPPVQLKAADRPAHRLMARILKFSWGGVPSRTLTGFTRQLATLLDAGIPIIKGLRSIEKQERQRILKGTIQSLIRDIEGGSLFSEALNKHPKIFNRLYINMVVAGEAGGMLESTLGRLADFMERAQKIRAKITASLFYPAAVITVAIAILTVMTVFVIPRFKDVFGDLMGSRQLPTFTQFVLGASLWVKSHVFYLMGTVIFTFIALNVVRATRTGHRFLDKLKLLIPVLGLIVQKSASSRFSRTLGTLTQNGVPILQALTIARESASNVVFAQTIDQLKAQVKEGANMTPTLEASGVFPSTVISMIDVGEQTGALPDMLLKVADNYDDEVDNAIAALMALLEPALIICLAVVVGGIVIALFMPLLDVMSKGFDNDPTTRTD